MKKAFEVVKTFFVETWRAIATAVNKWSLGPTYGAILTFMLLLSGLVGSLYSNEIKQELPISWIPGQAAGSSNVPRNGVVVLSFWATTLCATIMFFVREQALGRYQRNLIYKFSVLPPNEYLDQFKLIYRACTEFEDNAYESLEMTSRKKGEEAIEGVLARIALLCRLFSAKNKGSKVRANVMIYRSYEVIKTYDDETKDEMEKRLGFCPPNTAIRSLKGVLDLMMEVEVRRGIYTRTDVKGKKCMLLPLFFAHEHEDRHEVLPGAPLAFEEAFEERVFRVYNNRREVVKLARTNPMVREDTAHRLSEYLKKKNIESFFSMPLHDAEGKPIAVLNVLSDQPDILTQSDELVRTFEAMVLPFRLSVGKLVVSWSELEQKRTSTSRPIALSNAIP